MKQTLLTTRAQYLIYLCLWLFFSGCSPKGIEKDGCASHTDDATVDYQGANQDVIQQLLTFSGVKPWRIHSCSGVYDGKPPTRLGNGCGRDGFVDGAVVFAWKAETSYRQGNQTEAQAYAAQVREALDNANGLCSTTIVPTACVNCECGTSKIWPCKPVSGGGNGGGATTGTGTLIIDNTTYTDLEITLGGVTKIVPAGQKLSFSGAANASVPYSAKTSGKTSTGVTIGELITWDGTSTYPPSGSSLIVRFAVGASHFFLKLTNKSSLSWTKVLVNYGLKSGTTDNITIPNDSKTYWIGYYQAFTNSNVRTESGNTVWTWDSAKLGLQFTENQSVSLTGN